jgi:hypothetical protein
MKLLLSFAWMMHSQKWMMHSQKMNSPRPKEARQA